jgi:hypothetical protein
MASLIYVFYSNYKRLSPQIEFRRSHFLHRVSGRCRGVNAGCLQVGYGALAHPAPAPWQNADA